MISGWESTLSQYIYTLKLRYKKKSKNFVLNQFKIYTLLIGMPKYYTERGKLIRNNEAYALTGAPMYKSKKRYDTINYDIKSGILF